MKQTHLLPFCFLSFFEIKIVGSDGNEQRQPSSRELQSAIWEVCGDSGALQMLVDLLLAKYFFTSLFPFVSLYNLISLK